MTNPLIDATGTHRRIRAMMTQAWSLPIISRHAGYDAQSILKRPHVRTTTARALAQAYSRLRDHIGPVTATRTYATNHLYLPVHAWDHGYIDDPRHAAETEALTVWLDVAPDPAIDGGPMQHLLARLDTLLPRERAAVARRAHAMARGGDTRPVVLAGERLWQRDKWHRREGRPAA